MATIKPCGACGISGIHACLGAPIVTNDLLLIQTLSKRIAELEEELWRHTQKSEQSVNRAVELIEQRDERITELELKQQDIVRDIKACFGHAVACDGNLLVNACAYDLLVATCNRKVTKEQVK